MTAKPPVIWWIRRDLRLCDNPAVLAACESGAPVIPLYIHDAVDENLGAAPKFRLGLGLEKFAERLAAKGSRLILRRGPALEVLQSVLAEVGGSSVIWSRVYDPASVERDKAIKTSLKAVDINVKSTGGKLLFEPWTVANKSGGMFKVYTPFWKTVRDRRPEGLLPEPAVLPAPFAWPETESLAAVNLGGAMGRGAEIVLGHCQIGEAAAQDRLDAFLERYIDVYQAERDFLGRDVCSGLSENLAWGEISPHRIWNAGRAAMERGASGAEHFLKELVWREFAYHLLYYTPHITEAAWRPEWNGFPWNGLDDTGRPLPQIPPALDAWRKGRSGNDVVDAAMRELYVTGRMHNRTRMLVASYLCKHLMIHWKLGMQWFENCLVDWDPASNAMGWQWVAGCGPDAAPYFRVFNPDGQADKFDADHSYRHRWLAEGQGKPPETALSYYDAIPRSWRLRPDMARPEPIISLKAGRERALSAYENHRHKATAPLQKTSV